LLLIATWGVDPITFILAKCVFGLIIFTIARIKSGEESKEFAATEFKD
jgi:hypothetical protein